jgi:hypothetical protein
MASMMLAACSSSGQPSLTAATPAQSPAAATAKTPLKCDASITSHPARELRAFTISLSVNAGTKRGKARGSFVTSILETVENFYADVVQHVKPWTPPPVKVRDDEPQPARIHDVPQQSTPADARTGNTSDLAQTSAPE